MAPQKQNAADASHATSLNGPSTNSKGARSESSYESTSPSASEDETSSSGEDSDDEGDQAEQKGDDITTVPRPGKPQITNKFTADGANLMSRLSSFLPQIAAANASLEEDRAAGRLEEQGFEIPEGADKEQYIEMDLGLGVLEEKNPDAASSSESSDEDDTDQGEMDIDGSQTKDSNIMRHLMGQKKSASKPTIEDLGNG